MTEARVSVDGKTLGQIGPGLVILVGIARGDDERHIEYIVSKTVNLRIFEDSEGRFNLSALDIEADLLVISQFTLYADTRRGRRPGFTDAAPPDAASVIFEATLSRFRESPLRVETGRFQARMLVDIHNDGPVTIMIDSADRGL